MQNFFGSDMPCRSNGELNLNIATLGLKECLSMFIESVILGACHHHSGYVGLRTIMRYRIHHR